MKQFTYLLSTAPPAFICGRCIAESIRLVAAGAREIQQSTSTLGRRGDELDVAENGFKPAQTNDRVAAR